MSIHRFNQSILLFLLCALMFSISATAQNNTPKNNEYLTIIANNPNHLFYIKTANNIKQLEDYFIVHQMIGRNEFVVSYRSQASDQIMIEYCNFYNANMKYIPEIFEVTKKAGERYQVLVETIKDVDDASAIALFNKNEATYNKSNSWQSGSTWLLQVTDKQLLKIASSQIVLNIAPVFEDVPLNRECIDITNGQAARAPLMYSGFGLTGQGITVGVGDAGNQNHVDINDRMIKDFNPYGPHSHATHTTVTTLGAGIRSETRQGFAPKANLIGQFFSAVVVYSPTLYKDYNMSITNNSYAAFVGNCAYFGLYDYYSNYLDQLSKDYPKVLNIFAAGNDGGKSCPGMTPNYGTIEGIYQSSKNILAVANLGKNLQNYILSSSRGPTKDGRLKPEITGIGTRVVSGNTNNGYFENGGTSMAAPNIAGGAALLSEKYKSLYSGVTPDADILKSILMNGALDVGIEGPDYSYGFGLMDLGQSLSILNNAQFWDTTINDGATHTFDLVIPSGLEHTKVMLYWNDPAAAPYATSTLINDLDIIVKTPTGATIYPLVLNPATPTSKALQTVDSINNVEQVTIENPVAGTYQIIVKGTDITSGTQDYVVTYSFAEDKLDLVAPIGNESIMAGDSFTVYFKAPKTSNTFSVLFSMNNGSTWTTLSSTIADSIRHFVFKVPTSIAAANCLVAVKENGTSKSDTSAPFIIIGRPDVTLAPLSEQCPGATKINWNTIPGATSYAVFRNINGQMVAVDTVGGSVMSYTFTGLTTTTTQWFSVAAILDGKTGMRAVAVGRTPDNGGCTNIDLPEGDLTTLWLVSPKNGRINTSTALGTNEVIEVMVQNLSKNTATDYSVSYRVNGSGWKKQNFVTSIAPGSKALLKLNTIPINCLPVKNYEIDIAISNNAFVDENIENDTITTIVKQISNPLINLYLGYIEGFESTTQNEISANFLGIDGAEKWDFNKTEGYGRMSNFVSSDVTIEGKKSISLDLFNNTKPFTDSVSTNSLIATLNLSDINVNEKEVRADFNYRFAGNPIFSTDNAIFIRGNDLDPWIKVGDILPTSIGEVLYSNSLSLNDYLLANGQSFSTSTQIMIQQKDTSLICGIDFGNGLTIDNFRIYSVSNDISLDAVVSPQSQSCGDSLATDSTQVTLKIKNNVFYTLYDITVGYQFNGGPLILENVDSIPAKTEYLHTFDSKVFIANDIEYKINAFVQVADDEYTYNDSILDYLIIQKQNKILDNDKDFMNFYSSFEPSELDDAYTIKSNSAWQLSVPNAGIDKVAANGSYAWNVNNIIFDSTANLSYLYITCFNFDFSNPKLALSIQPTFSEEDTPLSSFNAYVEYQTADSGWQLLGAVGEGYHWYRNEANWSAINEPWQVASIPLPDADFMNLRVVFKGIPGSNDLGFSFDDIHIYPYKYDIYEDTLMSITNNVSIPGNQYTFAQGNQVIANLPSVSDNLGSTIATSYRHNPLNISNGNELILPRSFVIKPTNNTDKQVEVMLFIPHNDIEILNQSLRCNYCNKPNSIYELGITVYSTDETVELNESLSDNLKGQYHFIPKDDIRYIPYEKGYIAYFKTDKFGEFWFNSGGVNKNLGINENNITLSGNQISNSLSQLEFISDIDTNINLYYVMQKDASGEFITIAEIYPTNSLPTATYHYVDTPEIISGKANYVVKGYAKSGRSYFSNEIEIIWEKKNTFEIYPNPVKNSQINLSWYIDDLKEITYRIVDVNGRIIIQESFMPSSTMGMKRIEVSLPAGAYMVQISSGNQKMTQKLSIIR